MADELVLARAKEMEQALATVDPDTAAYMAKMSADKVQRVQNSLNSMKHGMHAVAPITCLGPRKCPFINHCPIPTREQKIRKDYGLDEDYPVMLPCIMERTFMTHKILHYRRRLKVDPDDPIEMALVNELALIDLYKYRASMILSEGDRDGDGRDFLRQDSNWQEAGDEYKETFTTSMHPAFDVGDKLERRRERLLERLLETRKSKAEIDLKRGVAQEDSNVLKELQAVKEYLQQAASRTQEDPGVIELPD